MKKLIRFLMVAYFTILVTFFGIWIFAKLSGWSPLFYPIFYWTIFSGWILIAVFFRTTSFFSMALSVFLYILATFVNIVGLTEVAEEIMRISFLGFAVGIIQAIMEYRKLTR